MKSLELSICTLKLRNELFFRCLTENGWDLNKATEAFHNAQREGKIPLAAFEK